MSGTLILVATPIGNQDDLSPRAAATLRDADVVLCEDTRVTARLLRSLSIDVPLLSYHDHNEASRIRLVLDYLAEGKTAALVSDAGMPGISDPGQRLVAAAAREGFSVTVIPGPSASIAALAVSGLDTRRFRFEGFIDAKGAGRKARLAALANCPDTVIIYEAPHRLMKTLRDLQSHSLGKRKLTVVRELTKTYEEILYVTVADAIVHFERVMPRGEFVLILEGETAFFARHPEAATHDQASVLNAAEAFIRERLPETLDKTMLRKAIEERFGISRNDAYRLILELSDETDMLE